VPRAYRPFVMAFRKKRRKPAEEVDRLASRYEQGLDLWTGEPLEGDDAQEWLRIYFGVLTKNVARILEVDGNDVTVQLKSGGQKTLKGEKNHDKQ